MSIALRIPMWGYETTTGTSKSTPAVSYESPCGVMSSVSGLGKELGSGLRIPMWGYEKIKTGDMLGHRKVTNPHVGL